MKPGFTSHRGWQTPALIAAVAGLAAFCFLGLSLHVPALPRNQSEEHVVEVKALLSQNAARPGDVVKAAVVLKIQPGYHINDNAPLDEFLFPTSLSIDENPSSDILEIHYPPGHRGRFAYSEAELIVYEGQTVLGALVKIKDGTQPGKLTLKASLSYQACDNMTCLPPKDLPFEVSIPIVTAGTEVHDLNAEIFRKIPFKSLSK